jgi:hypothetical protein
MNRQIAISTIGLDKLYLDFINIAPSMSEEEIKKEVCYGLLQQAHESFNKKGFIEGFIEIDLSFTNKKLKIEKKYVIEIENDRTIKTLMLFHDMRDEYVYFIELLGDYRYLDGVNIGSEMTDLDLQNEVIVITNDTKITKLDAPPKDWDFFIECCHY